MSCTSPVSSWCRKTTAHLRNHTGLCPIAHSISFCIHTAVCLGKYPNCSRPLACEMQHTRLVSSSSRLRSALCYRQCSSVSFIPRCVQAPSASAGWQGTAGQTTVDCLRFTAVFVNTASVRVPACMQACLAAFQSSLHVSQTFAAVLLALWPPPRAATLHYSRTRFPALLAGGRSLRPCSRLSPITAAGRAVDVESSECHAPKEGPWLVGQHSVPRGGGPAHAVHASVNHTSTGSADLSGQQHNKAPTASVGSGQMHA